MKLKEGYILRTVLGQYIVMPAGEFSDQLGGKLVLNESGAFLWKLLQQDREKDELVQCILEEYDTDKESAKKAVDAFLTQLEKLPELLMQ